VPSARSDAGAGPAVRVLVAGVDREARGPIEAVVRRVFASRPPGESWSVSLVRLADRWSVTLDGPGAAFRNLSFTAGEQDVARVLAQAIGTDAAATATPAEGGSPARGPVEDRHRCPRCGGTILLRYESHAGETREPAPVACPHCWAVHPLEIGTWAAVGGDYRAEKG
jgi:hypothetical protein